MLLIQLLSYFFFDKLFDSINGSFDKVVDGKIYRTAIKTNSVHHGLWADNLKVLSTMKFIGKNDKPVSVPTLKNWITTIRGMLYTNIINNFNKLKYFCFKDFKHYQNSSHQKE